MSQSKEVGTTELTIELTRLMLLSPIVQPGRVTFPGPGEEGRGVVAGVQLRALAGRDVQVARLPLDHLLEQDAEVHAAGLRLGCRHPAVSLTTSSIVVTPSRFSSNELSQVPTSL